jgi:hypothetical protein
MIEDCYLIITLGELDLACLAVRLRLRSQFAYYYNRVIIGITH